MSPDDRRHGTERGASQHRRDGDLMCEPCRVAAARGRAARKERLKAAGRAHVPVGVEAWRIAVRGPVNAISEQTGLSLTLLKRVRGGGPETLVERSTRTYLLGYRSWTPIGVQRRVQALAAIGWSAAEVARRVGVDPDGVKQLRRREVKQVKVDFAERIIATFDELCMTAMPPTGDAVATRQRNEARAKGWPPPLAWDDIDHDDAPATPVACAAEDDLDELAVQRAFDGDTSVLPLNAAERLELVRRWLAADRTTNVLEHEYGINPWREVKALREAERSAA